MASVALALVEKCGKNNKRSVSGERANTAWNVYLREYCALIRPVAAGTMYQRADTQTTQYHAKRHHNCAHTNKHADKD